MKKIDPGIAERGTLVLRTSFSILNHGNIMKGISTPGAAIIKMQ